MRTRRWWWYVLGGLTAMAAWLAVYLKLSGRIPKVDEVKSWLR